MGRIPARRIEVHAGYIARNILYRLFACASVLLRCAQSATTFLSANIWYAGREESRQIPRFDLTSHLVLLNVAVEVRPIQQESFPDLNMWNRPLPNQVPYGPNGAR
jgi:hypothetical protein